MPITNFNQLPLNFVQVPAEGVVTLDFIVPVGNNRIVTVVGYTTEGAPVPGSTLKSAIDASTTLSITEPAAIDFETTMAADAIEGCDNAIAQTLFDANTDTRPGYPPIVPDLTTVPIGYDQQLTPGRVTVYVKTSNGNQFTQDLEIQVEDPTPEVYFMLNW